MNALSTALKELYGLFVEDGSYALGIVLWLLVVGVVFSQFPQLGFWRAVLLFAGLVFLLIENVLRTARK
jgi:hypothetical protein